MSTKTFSSRAETDKLAFADALTRKELGMSFGQYCGSVLLDAVCNNASLPNLAPDAASATRMNAVNSLKELSERFHNPTIGAMSDDEIRDLIASRYA